MRAGDKQIKQWWFRMDFDKAMAAHADWKVKLRVALQNGDTLDAARICSDKTCDLGRWLHGEARTRWSGNANYLNCVETHRQFHECAGKVAETINRKDFATAEKLLGIGSPFSDASSNVAVAVRRMKREAEVLA